MPEGHPKQAKRNEPYGASKHRKNKIKKAKEEEAAEAEELRKQQIEENLREDREWQDMIDVISET